MPIEDIEFYDERTDLSLDVLSLDLVRQLAHLVWRLLKLDGRESSYVDENDCFRTARIARLPVGMALVEASGTIACYLIEESDVAAIRFKARRCLFLFETDDSMAPGNWRFCPAAPPDLWYNMVMTTLTMHLDNHA